MNIAKVFLDIPTRSFDDAFDYLVPDEMADLAVGCCVQVEFGHRKALGYVVGLCEEEPAQPEKLKPVQQVLSTPFFDEESASLARWIAREYAAPLSEAIHLFTPPGSSPRLKKNEAGEWVLEHPGIGPVDDRWVQLTEEGRGYVPPKNAVKQAAILSILAEGEVRVAELALDVSNPHPSLKALEKRGVIKVETRRRLRGSVESLPVQGESFQLTAGQQEALNAIHQGMEAGNGSVILLDGVTGSGKTEVYLRAIRSCLERGGSACVLVPEISLTPQTVARFRARFGSLVAVLHSRLSLGERFDQWDLVRSGTARVVVGARSALFAPLHNLQLVIIDEEHENSYKQSSSPCYVTRDVAAEMVRRRDGTLVLGSASPSMETLYRCETGGWRRVVLPERTCGKGLPPVEVVDLSKEFKEGNKTMFSTALSQALIETVEKGEKAVLLLNKRGFASFLLCRDCGYVPECEQCSSSFTYHLPRNASQGFLLCHHCGLRREAPTVCPVCGSPYLRQLGPGTQFAYDQLKALLPPDTTIVRMDADTTSTKGAHERLLDEFAASSSGVLLGTQMIAKGLDFPDVTLVGVLIADTTLKLPDFRAAERTYQLLEQVSGRAGRAEKDGRVIVQTYQPDSPAVRAAAGHDREILLAGEREARSQLGYPPYTRLANLVLWGKEVAEVREEAQQLHARISAELAKMEGVEAWQILGPAPCVLSRLKGNHRWHILIKAPLGADIPGMLAAPLKERKTNAQVRLSVDIDPVDLM